MGFIPFFDDHPAISAVLVIIIVIVIIGVGIMIGAGVKDPPMISFSY
jgi:hypothetical protein